MLIPGRLVLAGACAALLAAAWFAAASPLDLVVFLVGLAAFTAPGWPLGRWLAGSGRDGWSRLIVALVLGYVAGALLVVTLRAAGVTSPVACFGASLIGRTMPGPRGAGCGTVRSMRSERPA